METQIQKAGSEPVISDETDIRWAVNVLLEKIAAKFESNEAMDVWRSDAAAIVRSFKHNLTDELEPEVTVGMVTAALASVGEFDISLFSLRRREVTKMIQAALDWRKTRIPAL